MDSRLIHSITNLYLLEEEIDLVALVQLTMIDPLDGSIIQPQNSRSPGLRIDWPGSELNTIASVGCGREFLN